MPAFRSYILIPVLLLWTSCDSLPADSISLNSNQWKNIMRDAIKFLEKHQKEQERVVERKPKIRFIVDPSFTGGSGKEAVGSGMVKLRNIRSGYGDVANAVRLYQLHELEKEWASKARPRFGKRAEVAQENFLPPYPLVFAASSLRAGDDYDHDDYRAGGDFKVRLGPLLPEDYAQDVAADRVKGEQDYSIPNA